MAATLCLGFGGRPSGFGRLAGLAHSDNRKKKKLSGDGYGGIAEIEYMADSPCLQDKCWYVCTHSVGAKVI